MYSVCGAAPLAAQPRALRDAEAMLLVDDHQARAARTRRSRSAARACRPRAPPRPSGCARSRARRSRAPELPNTASTRDAERQQQRRELLRVLRGEDLGRRHQRALQRRRDARARSRPPRPASCRCRRRPAAAGSSAPSASCRAQTAAITRCLRRRSARTVAAAQKRRPQSGGQRDRGGAAGGFAARALERRGQRDAEELLEDRSAGAPRSTRCGIASGACTSRQASAAAGKSNLRASSVGQRIDAPRRSSRARFLAIVGADLARRQIFRRARTPARSRRHTARRRAARGGW